MQMITALPHRRRRVMKWTDERFQYRLYRHIFSWVPGRLN